MGLLGMAAKGPSPTHRLLPQPHLAVSSLAASVALIHCFLNTWGWLTSPSPSPRQWSPPAPQSKTTRHESTQVVPPSSVSSSSNLDPLLMDLTKKKLSFKRKVVSLSYELKGVRSKLAS
uniref:Uncharacterized protein n=1 Tax=Zea mays TaxID=4577 RepID=A0A804MEW5_MAIZE